MLILWNTTNNVEKEVDIVKVDVKPFVTNSNKFESHFYDNGIGTLRLIGNMLICQGQNYCMTETSLESIEQGVSQVRPNLARFGLGSVHHDGSND